MNPLPRHICLPHVLGTLCCTVLVLWRPSSKAGAVLKISRLDRVMTVVIDDEADPFAA